MHENRETTTVEQEWETPWLDNGFDEVALRRNAKRELEAAISATPRPRHWKVVDVPDDAG